MLLAKPSGWNMGRATLLSLSLLTPTVGQIAVPPVELGKMVPIFSLYPFNALKKLVNSFALTYVVLFASMTFGVCFFTNPSRSLHISS